MLMRAGSTRRILPRTARYDNLTFQAPMPSSARTPERIDDSQTNRLSPIASARLAGISSSWTVVNGARRT